MKPPIQPRRQFLLLALLLSSAAAAVTSCASRVPDASPAPQAPGAQTLAATAAKNGTATAGSPGTAGPPAAAVSPSPAASPGTASGTGSAGAGAAHRVDLPGAEGVRFPYTVELPEGWEVVQPKDAPIVWLGPKGADPAKDPRGVYVRISTVSLADPGAVAANIRKTAAESKDWRADLVEVREVGGVRGVLVQMESGQGTTARSTLVLKMPLPKTSVDFMASASSEEFARLRPSFERILFSVRPVT